MTYLADKKLIVIRTVCGLHVLSPASRSGRGDRFRGGCRNLENRPAKKHFNVRYDLRCEDLVGKGIDWITGRTSTIGE